MGGAAREITREIGGTAEIMFFLGFELLSLEALPNA